MSGRGKLWRSRWAAIGAAVAVTLGAGGLATTFADSAASSFVAITPVRVLDTRASGFGGAIAANTPRTLQVTGTIQTIGADGQTVSNAVVVPAGATAIVANVTAVSPTSAGFVSVRPATATGVPATSNINFTAAGVVVPNSVTVEVPTTGPAAGQIQLYFGGGAGAVTELLVDIVGYYQAGGSGTPGPQGPAGATGATGPRGFSAWDTIPSGVTVRGSYALDISPFALIEDGVSIPLPGVAPQALLSGNVQFSLGAPENFVDDRDARCAGTVDNPTAPAGMVCIYEYGLTGMSNVAGQALTFLPETGFYVKFIPTNEGDALIKFTWAYTAP